MAYRLGVDVGGTFTDLYLVGDGNMGLAVFNTASVALIFIFSRIEIDDWLDNARARGRARGSVR